MIIIQIKQIASVVSQMVTELFINGRKLSIYLVFVTQSYLAVPKIVRLISTHHFIRKIRNECELQSITFNDSSDIDYYDLNPIDLN